MLTYTIVTDDGRVFIELPAEYLDRLGLSAGSALDVELDEARQSLRIQRRDADALAVDAEYKERVARFIERYRPALEALAKR
jgi:hypothetical protein